MQFRAGPKTHIFTEGFHLSVNINALKYDDDLLVQVRIIRNNRLLDVSHSISFVPILLESNHLYCRAC